MKLLDEVRHVARLRRLALPTERGYVRWIEHFIHFHRMGAAQACRLPFNKAVRLLQIVAQSRPKVAATAGLVTRP